MFTFYYFCLDFDLVCSPIEYCALQHFWKPNLHYTHLPCFHDSYVICKQTFFCLDVGLVCSPIEYCVLFCITLHWLPVQSWLVCWHPLSVFLVMSSLLRKLHYIIGLFVHLLTNSCCVSNFSWFFNKFFIFFIFYFLLFVQLL